MIMPIVYPLLKHSSKWGQLPAFESKRVEGTKKRYGFSGNSFIAAVSFGKKIRG